MKLHLRAPRWYVVTLVSVGMFAGFSIPAFHAAERPVPQTPATETDSVELTATLSDQPATGVRIHFIRWSSDEDWGTLVAALENPQPEPPAADEGRGGGRGGRGGGGGGRGDAEDPPEDPITTAVSGAATVGYIWTDSSVSGYAIKYAERQSMPDGGERIVLVTTRRPATRMPAEDEFTLIEVRLDSNGLGEGKASLLVEATIDGDAGRLAVDNYPSTPVLLDNVRR